MRTGRAEKPIPSASDPSTWSGRLWTGERRRVFPPNHGDHSAVIETRQARRNAGMSDLLLLGARHRALGYKRVGGAHVLGTNKKSGTHALVTKRSVPRSRP